MTTQAQLRSALSARADQSNTQLQQAEAAIVSAVLRTQRPSVARHRRSLLAGVLVAAAVSAAVVIPAVIAAPRHGSPAAPTPAATHQVAGPTGAVAPQPATSRPVTMPTSAAAPPRTGTPSTTGHIAPPVPGTATVPSNSGKPAAGPSDGSVAPASVANLIGVGIDRSINWDLRPEAEYVTVQLPGTTHASITAFAPAAGFSRSRISAAQPVTIAGKPGWFGNVSVWPANGRPDPVSGKQDGAVPSVAWQLGGTWVVVQSDDSSVLGPAKVAALAETLQITAEPPALRTPFTVGYLPKDLALTNYGFYQQVSGDSLRPSWGVSLTAGTTSLDVSLVPASEKIDVEPGDGVTQVKGTAHAGFVLQVTGKNLSVVQLEQVLRGTTVTADPAGSTAGWPLLGNALP